MSGITFAVTHYNRFTLLKDCLTPVLGDPRITEIVISDDCSTDGSYEQILAYSQEHSKIRVYQNEKNLDCYRNKAAAVSRSTNPWVILFDSDNVINTGYVDALYVLPAWDPNVFYCPEFAEPAFDYRAYTGLVVDQHNVAQLMGTPVIKPVMVRRIGMMMLPVLEEYNSRFRCALNTANYFVHRDSYMGVWDGRVDPHTSDTIYHALNWLRSGRRLTFVKGMRYYHRIHKQSHYVLNKHKTGGFHQEVEQRLKALV